MNRLVLFLLSIIFTSTTFADFGVYKLPITRDGETHTKIAYNWWSGEYPGPVPHVTKQTMIAGYKSLRKLTEKVNCTIEEGIYHPWSQNVGSLINFYTLSNVIDVVFTGDKLENFLIENEEPWRGFDINKGDVIENIHYLSEGYCGGEHVVAQNDRAPVSFSCEPIWADADFEFLSESKDMDWGEQWLYMSCAEGHKAFVEDKTMLLMPNVKEGVILDYGTVGPATN